MKHLKLYAVCSVMALSAIMGNAPQAFAFSQDNANRIITVSPTGSDSTAEVRNALTTLQNRSDKASKWTLKFNPGTYQLAVQIVTDKLENVDFVSDPNNPAIIRKTSGWNTANGEFLMFNKFSKNISIRGFQFYGQTNFASNANPVWPDQGVYFGSSNGLVVDNNKFYNFGNAAFRVATYEKDPVAGVNSFNTKVTNNVFNNVYQISTTSNDMIHGATAYYLLQNNQFVNIRGSIKFASRTAGAKDVKILNNTVNGGDHYAFEIDNYDNFEIRDNKIQNIKSVAINVYTNARAPKGFPWGDNFTIANNTIQSVGRGIRFSPDPYTDGYKPVPNNLVIDNNTISGMTESAPAIGVINGTVKGVKITNNKLSAISSKNYISVTPTSTNVVLSGNLVDGLAWSGNTSGGGTTPPPTNPPPTTPPPATGGKPAAPSGLTGQLNGQALKLSWSDNANNESSFQIWYGTNGSQYNKLADIGSNVTSYTHTMSSPSSYYYTVRAVNSSGASVFSNVYKSSLTSGGGTTPPPTNPPPTTPPPATGGKPAAPSGLTGQLNGQALKLSWSDNANNESSFQIWYGTNGSQYNKLADIGSNVTSYTHTMSSPSSYYYTVRAVNSSGASVFSNVYKSSLTSGGGTTPPPTNPPPTNPPPATGGKPAAPSKLQAVLEGGTVKLSWTDNADNESSLQVWVSPDGGQYSEVVKLGANTTSYSYSPGGSGPLYYTVRSVNSAGASGFCPVAKITR